MRADVRILFRKICLSGVAVGGARRRTCIGSTSRRGLVVARASATAYRGRELEGCKKKKKEKKKKFGNSGIEDDCRRKKARLEKNQIKKPKNSRKNGVFRDFSSFLRSDASTNSKEIEIQFHFSVAPRASQSVCGEANVNRT